MSWFDGREWQAGYPPTREAFEATMRRVRHGKRLELAEGPSSVHAAPEERFTETLAEAQARRRANQAKHAAELDLSEEAVSARADALQREMNWLGLFSSEGARVDLEDAAEQATPKADALLAEMRELGLL